MTAGDARRLLKISKRKLERLIKKDPTNIRKNLLLRLMLQKLYWRVCEDYITNIRNITHDNYINDDF